MPNPIENHLTIEGPQSDIDALVKKAAGPDNHGQAGHHTITFHAFVSMPADVFRGSVDLREQERMGIKHWYNWSVKNWGTKWDAYQTTFKKEIDPVLEQLAAAFAGKNKKGAAYGRALFTFQTAWAAPHPVIAAMAKQHKSLKIKHEYSDEDSSGCNHGCNIYIDGKLDFQESYDGSGNPDPDDPIRDLSIRLHGRDRYQPQCESCDEELTQDEAANQELNGRYGTCDDCKDQNG
jgi:Api92-like protein with ferredoxin domain